MSEVSPINSAEQSFLLENTFSIIDHTYVDTFIKRINSLFTYLHISDKDKAKVAINYRQIMIIHTI